MCSINSRALRLHLRMRTTLLLLFCYLGMTCVQADTIDFYHVYFRGSKVAEFSQGNKISIVLKASSIGTNDSITVKVYRDAKCMNCTYGLLIFGAKSPVYIDTSRTDDDFVFPLAPLLADRTKNGGKTFTGYYTEYLSTPDRCRVISFMVTLE